MINTRLQSLLNDKTRLTEEIADTLERYRAIAFELYERVGKVKAFCGHVSCLGGSPTAHPIEELALLLPRQAKQLESMIADIGRTINHPGLFDLSGIPVLFLDIDGVLNCSATLERVPDGARGIEPAKLALVWRIVQRTGCQVVVTSTWRRYPERYLHFSEACLEGGVTVLDVTPLLDESVGGFVMAKSRRDEIVAWIQAHRYKGRFVIVDDEGGLDDLSPWVVRTSVEHGLTEELAEQVIRMFGPIPR